MPPTRCPYEFEPDLSDEDEFSLNLSQSHDVAATSERVHQQGPSSACITAPHQGAQSALTDRTLDADGRDEVQRQGSSSSRGRTLKWSKDQEVALMKQVRLVHTIQI